MGSFLSQEICAGMQSMDSLKDNKEGILNKQNVAEKMNGFEFGWNTSSTSHCSSCWLNDARKTLILQEMVHSFLSMKAVFAFDDQRNSSQRKVLGMVTQYHFQLVERIKQLPGLGLVSVVCVCSVMIVKIPKSVKTVELE